MNGAGHPGALDLEIDVIVSRNNRRIKAIRRLLRSKAGRDRIALLEGVHLIEEALAADIPLEEVLVTAEFQESAAGRRLLLQIDREVLVITRGLFRELAQTTNPTGIVAIAELPRGGASARTASGPADARPADVKSDTQLISLYLDGIQDPINLGAIARTAEAAGCRELFLGPGCAHPNHPRALRASAGSLLRIPALPVPGLEKAVSLVEASGSPRPRLLALAGDAGTPLWQAPLEGPLLLLLGAEGQGLSSDTRALADIAVSIPLAAPVESLNVTVAAAVTLFEIRRRRAAGTESPA